MDLDPDSDLDVDLDSAMFLIDLQDVNKKLIYLLKSFFDYYFLKLHLHHFQG